MTLAEEMSRFFAEDGPLAALLPGYRPRTAQIAMAESVAEALEDASARLVVEAGTGTGKSLAYLVPSLLGNRQVAVATGTKALQDQLYEKDVPLVLEAVRLYAGLAESPKRAALMKGRQNYLCLTRWERFSASPTFAFHDDAKHMDRLRDWVATTQKGDRAEVEGLPESFGTWADLDAGSETCVGQKCPAFQDCFVTKMRRDADTADLVVVNHHLLCADLRVRLEGMPNGTDTGVGFAQVIPDVHAVIVDEAHQLPDVATDYFGVHFVSGRTDRLKSDIGRLAGGGGEKVRGALERAVTAFEVTLDEVIGALGGTGAPLSGGASDRRRLGPGLDKKALRAMSERIQKALADVCVRLETLGEALPEAILPEITGLVRRTENVAVELGFLLDRALSDASFVAWLEPKKRGFALSAAPVDVASALNATLFGLERPVVLTSATLAVDESAASFMRRVGLSEEESAALLLPSPFQYEARACLYAPADMPAPDDEAFFERFCDEVTWLVSLTRGGALVLFTSLRALDRAAEKLAPVLAKRGITLLKQGDAPKLQLLDALKVGDATGGAALFATQSFWEGVDVPGSALRLVVIDRLPFRPPTDPLQRARQDLFEAQGLSSFQHISVPEAALALKQGVGRLIRTEDDAGIVAVLDGRLRRKGYGKVFLRTLPPLLRVGTQKVVEQFFERVVLPTMPPSDEATTTPALEGAE